MDSGEFGLVISASERLCFNLYDYHTRMSEKAAIDAKHPLDDFFAGLTGRCVGFADRCGRLLQSKADKMCRSCQYAKEHEEFKNKFAKMNIAFKMVWEIARDFAKESREKYAKSISDNWYMRREQSFVCLICGYEYAGFAFAVVRNSDGRTEPAMACCVNKDCALAKEFWGEKDLAFDQMRNDAIKYASELKAARAL